MPQIIEADYQQIHLLPAVLEDWVGAEHPARFVREFVRAVDLRGLGFKEPAHGEEGRPAYSVELMLRVWLYGYLEKVRSTRKLERACREQMGFIWLCGNRAPDHNSLWRFWQANRGGLRKVFKQTVKVALELNLVGLVLQAVDGTKIQAACSGRGIFDAAALEKAIEELDEVIAAREKALEEEGNGPGDEQKQKRLRYDQLSVEGLREALARVEAGESRHVHPREPEARRMESEGRNRFSYNAQVVVDQKEQIVVAAEVVNSPNDQAQLNAMIAAAAENTRAVAPQGPTTLADGGYSCGKELQAAAEAGREVLMPLAAGTENRHQNAYHASCFRPDETADVVICPQGRRLAFRRLRQRGAIMVREYRSAKVCQECPVRRLCTRDRHGRSIEIAPWDRVVRKHGEKMAQPLSRALLAMRGGLVEPVFAWIKAHAGFRRWSLSGLENVRTQWALLCGVCNLRVIYRCWLTRTCA